MPSRDFHRIKDLPHELQLHIWTHAALPTELLGLNAYNEDGPSEADEDVYEWDERGAVRRHMQYFRYVS